MTIPYYKEKIWNGTKSLRVLGLLIEIPHKVSLLVLGNEISTDKNVSEV